MTFHQLEVGGLSHLSSARPPLNWSSQSLSQNRYNHGDGNEDPRVGQAVQGESTDLALVLAAADRQTMPCPRDVGDPTVGSPTRKRVCESASVPNHASSPHAHFAGRP